MSIRPQINIPKKLATGIVNGQTLPGHCSHCLHYDCAQTVLKWLLIYALGK